MMHTEGIRDVIRYIRKFKGSTIVIRMDDDVVDSPLFSSHIHDLALLHETGIRIVLIPGAHEHISRVLDSYGIAWKIENTIRITSDEGMNFIKMAAFDVSNRIMTRLSAEGLTAVIGNWVRARGVACLTEPISEVPALLTKSSSTPFSALEDGFIPIIPCIGWTSTGKPYNISSTELAVATATALKAGKLFFLGSGNTISIDDFTIPESASLSPEGRLAALSVESIDEFLELNRDSGSPTLPVDKLTDLLLQARTACLGGVTRAHILDADIDGVIPAEIFSDLGSGTMIYVNNYGTFRAMTREDIPAVLSLMNPFVEKGILLPRTSEELEQKAHEFVVFEIDGGIRACAALHSYPENVGEIAGLAVDEAYAHMGIGPRLMDLLLQREKRRIFVACLTTQTGDWFEKFGFKSAETGQLPRERQEKWDPKRRSRVFIKTF